MKKLLILSALIVLFSFAQGQTNEEIKALITGYRMLDTIKIDDFIKLTEITLNNKEYSIVSFSMSVNHGGFTISQTSYSDKITDKMKEMLLNIKDSEFKVKKVYIENIKAKNSAGKEVQVPPLIYSVRIK